ncbi:unnamed protein product [Miscanthus lutarioriparius]|uniref:Uncharacterized protein n=1 Tax=Miscanthus lutarioriparius TaxID=422564 RepID=A0A811S9S2_9POAL|nr:unnamed protein product [Miscanthus lutarioriparius]
MAPLMATALGFILLTANSILAIHRSWGDAAATIFVIASYTTLLLLFRCLRDYERAAPGSPARERARRAVWPLTTLLTLGVVNCDMALAIHKARNNLVSTTCVLVTHAALLALVWLLVREFAGHARGVVGSGQDQGQGRSVGAADAAH